MTDELDCPQKWELVYGNNGTTERLKIPGGYLYRTTVWGYRDTDPPSVAMVFVPNTTDTSQS